jgi:uncharacterized protein YjbI with pentapeptide repeats
LDFSGAHLDFGIFSKARFKGARFNRATLKDLYVHEAILTGADFGGVTEFEGSRWEESDWWDAKCIPQPMLAYIQKVDHHDLTPEVQSRLVAGCK